MKKLGLNEIRTEFLKFFEEKDHIVLKSYSLIPENDKSLLLINAGMAPLKGYFLGEKKMAKPRATSSQRCIRTADIDNVGITHRHATFFEMLGNFSFGDYFKKEAIAWAWEFLTERLEIDPEKLWVTVYEEDDEAFNIWHEQEGVPVERIVRLGKEDNFWELEQGPCGPCSEIHYDRGPEYGCGSEDCKPGCDCDRFMEIWNLVFTQFDKTKDGKYLKLEHPNIDTGMGLERIVLVMEDAPNIFEVKAMLPIRHKIEELAGVKYGEDEKQDISVRVILDHSKAVCFLVYDGVVPSNEGRGYVLRRLIRRAARHGKLLGIKGEFLNQVIEEVMKVYYPEYPELTEDKERIFRIVEREEKKFQETIDQGLEILNDYIQEMWKKDETVLSGEQAFKLYDTYGFPLDLTKEILMEKALTVDERGFKASMEEQKRKSREGRSTGAGWVENEHLDLEGLPKTDFLGYESFCATSKALRIFKDGEEVNTLEEGEEGILVVDQTPFYAESGGQIGDLGTFGNEHVLVRVTDTHKNKDEIFLHRIEVEKGSLEKDEVLNSAIDEDRRRDIMKNHSATHLLHKALRDVLGGHVHQAGSLVDEYKTRFDFTHFEAVTKEQLKEIESQVNRRIYEAIPVTVETMSLEESHERGAMGLFEDKYKDIVRVITMGDSVELCGGTHVSNTSEIQMFKIVSETGIAAGVRRIEAITGRKVYERLLMEEKELKQIATSLKVNKDQIGEKIEALQTEVKDLQDKMKEVQKEQQKQLSENLSDDVEMVGEIALIAKRVDGMDMNALRDLADRLRDKTKNAVVVLGSENEGKVLFVCAVDKDLAGKEIHAGNIVRMVAQHTGGNGGGRPDFASAGGKDVSKIDEALNQVKGYLEK